MSQQKLFEREYGKVKIRVYGGLNEIGGNCVVIEDGDRKIVFDNGIRFSLLRKFYGGRIEPLRAFRTAFTQDNSASRCSSRVFITLHLTPPFRPYWIT